MQAQDIPYGYCHCGCGQKTRLAASRNTRDGHRLGEPLKFIYGHRSRLERAAPEVRFERHTDKDGPVPEHRPDLGACWVWRANRTRDGYGTFRVAGKMIKAHVWIWTQTHGPVPAGREMDHLCRNTSCVNPTHLEAVTRMENNRRRPYVRLNAEAARAIRRSSLTGRELAVVYGVSMTAVYDARSGKSWRDV